MEGKRCRLWWPKQLLRSETDSGLVLFGWYFGDLSSLDIVVAAAISPSQALGLTADSHLVETLQSITRVLPVNLQESSTFKPVGFYAAYDNVNDWRMKSQNSHLENRKPHSLINKGKDGLGTSVCGSVIGEHAERLPEGSSPATSGGSNCGCENLSQFKDLCKSSSTDYGIWLRLVSTFERKLGKEKLWIPELHHVHLEGLIFPIDDVHLIIYKPPAYDSHHFSLRCSDHIEKVGLPIKKPIWITELHKKRQSPDLGPVILALNCATSASELLQRQLSNGGHSSQSSGQSVIGFIFYHTMAMFLASISTAIFIILQIFYKLLDYGSNSVLKILSKPFRATWKNVHIRSSQFLYWPVLLQGYCCSFKSNVEYSHRVTLRKHQIWSSVAVDILLGSIVGLTVLANIDAICFWVSTFARNLTDNLLRSGCVWLMDVPAGFKLNTELAECLGMISLNAIQAFSTLWVLMGSWFRYCVIGIALFGFLFGVTVLAALCIDMLMLATLHILILHWAISFLYAQQIRALASLWRLFRGRKWNPLRQRLDSYDYTVEQHVVGSLFFTPLLLLLPTTSVFYIFFTMLYTAISVSCIMIEIIISLLHATPYLEILLWVIKRRIFPSGVWFKFVPVPLTSTLSHQSLSDDTSRFYLERKKAGFLKNEQSQPVVSLLESNHLTIGQIIGPHYRKVFQGVSSSFVRSSAHGILAGQRMPSSLQTSLPSVMPWIHISFVDYWMLCYSSVLSCRP